MPVGAVGVKLTEDELGYTAAAAAGPAAETSALVPFRAGCNTGSPDASPLVPFRVGCNTGS